MGKFSTASVSGGSGNCIHVKDGGIIMHADLMHLGCDVHVVINEQPKLGYKPGAISIGNKELAERSSATHMVYEDERSALRGMIQAKGGYTNLQHGEVVKLAAQCLTAESCIITVRAISDPRESVALRDETDRLYQALRTVRNREKKKGQEHLQNARFSPETADQSLGMMVMHLKRRMEEIPEVLAGVDRRIILLSAYIDDALARHRAVQRLTKVPAGEHYPNEFREHIHNLHYRRNREKLAQQLRELMAFLVANRDRPLFQKAANRTLGYIQDAIGAVTADDGKTRKEVKGRLIQIFKKIHQEQQWVFVGHDIHQAILHIDLISETGLSTSGLQEQLGALCRQVQELCESSTEQGHVNALQGLDEVALAFTGGRDRQPLLALCKQRLKQAAMGL